jgi:hypothetical protein
MGEDSECSVCLEPLEGTIVTLGCCHNRIHIQCYVDKCPFCRSQLPKPEHVVVPVPVTVIVPQELTRAQKFFMVVFPSIGSMAIIGAVLIFVNASRH